MNRKAGFPSSTCSIALPQSSCLKEDDSGSARDDNETHYKKRQHLITFGHSQWGFNNWSWGVTKQELDYVEFSNGKYFSGVVAFVSVTVHSLNIHREDIGYATSVAMQKGSAIHNARKSSVTNALRETLLGFGGDISTILLKQLESNKANEESHKPTESDNLANQSAANRPFAGLENVGVPKDINSNAQKSLRKDSSGSSSSADFKKAPENRSPQHQGNQQQADHVNDKPYVLSSNAVSRVNIPPPQMIEHQTGGNQMSRPPPAAVRSVSPVMTSASSAGGPAPPAPPHIGPQPDSSLPEEELRAERKRRQRMKQEEFRLKQLQSDSSHKPIVQSSEPPRKRESSPSEESIEQNITEALRDEKVTGPHNVISFKSTKRPADECNLNTKRSRPNTK